MAIESFSYIAPANPYIWNIVDTAAATAIVTSPIWWAWFDHAGHILVFLVGMVPAVFRAMDLFESWRAKRALRKRMEDHEHGTP